MFTKSRTKLLRLNNSIGQSDPLVHVFFLRVTQIHQIKKNSELVYSKFQYTYFSKCVVCDFYIPLPWSSCMMVQIPHSRYKSIFQSI